MKVVNFVQYLFIISKLVLTLEMTVLSRTLFLETSHGISDPWSPGAPGHWEAGPVRGMMTKAL
jgi:hypothetical protein